MSPEQFHLPQPSEFSLRQIYIVWRGMVRDVPTFICHMKKLSFVLSLLALCLTQKGLATDITVTTTADAVNGDTTSIQALLNNTGGDGISLREAVIAANNTANFAPHRILLPAGTYQLTKDGTMESYPADAAVGDLDITRSGTTIEGANAATTIIRQTTINDRVIEVNPNLDPSFSFTIQKVTIRGGRETTGIGGGGLISGATMNQTFVTDCIFVDNSVSSASSAVGGAIANAGGDLMVSNCTFDSNTSFNGGGAIVFDTGTPAGPGVLNILTSQFINNVSLIGNGGAIETTGPAGMYAVNGCVFSGNQVRGYNTRGGAIHNESGTLTVGTSTFVTNQATDATGAGGAIGSSDGSGHNVTISYCRFLGNTTATPANGLTLRGGVGSTMTANDNWWGVNSGPSANSVINATTTLWLQLAHSASPATIASGVGGTSTFTAGFLTDSGGNTISAANLSALVGLPITFNGVNKGTLSSVQTTLQASGTATALFTATASGSGSAVANIDFQSVTATVAIAPSVNSVSVPANSLYGIGQTLSFTVHYNETVTVVGGTPYIPALLDSGDTLQADYVSGSGTSDLVFSGTIAEGVVDADGIQLGSAINANGAEIRDLNGTDAILTLHTIPALTGILVDAVTPSIVISGPTPTMTVSSPVDFTITYSDSNFDSISLDASDVTLNTTSTATGTVSVLGTGLTRTIQISNITGHGTLGISIAAGTATDLAGNPAPAAGPSSTVTVNLPPAITGTVSGQPVNDNATIYPFSGATIANADAPAQILTSTITLDNAAKGAFTPASLAASGFLAAGSGVYTFGGTAANATTAIRLLEFAPASNRVPRDSTETTIFTINVTDGVFTPVANSITTVVTTSVNHSPVAVADTIQRYATEGVKVGLSTLLANDTDPDSDTLTITAVSPTSPNGGTIYLANNWIHYVPAAGFTAADTFTYTINDGHGSNAVGTVTVAIKTDQNPGSSQIGSIQNLGSSIYRITFGGIPGRTYTIQYTESLTIPIVWQTLGTATATANGTFTFDDNSGSLLRFYRAVYP
jgi:hypothetical protein